MISQAKEQNLLTKSIAMKKKKKERKRKKRVLFLLVQKWQFLPSRGYTPAAGKDL